MVKNISFEELKEPKFVKVEKMNYQYKGKDSSWEIARVYDSVAILLYDEIKKEVVLVKQFRPPVYIQNSDGYTYELCAGIVDKDKSLEQIAIEEVYEECGYKIDSVEKITSFYTSVGFAGAKQTLFFATVDDSMRVNSGGGINGEDIEVVKLSIDKLDEFIYDESKAKTPGLMFSFEILKKRYNI
jgi:UDP-sugar diphosphatase